MAVSFDYRGKPDASFLCTGATLRGELTPDMPLRLSDSHLVNKILKEYGHESHTTSIRISADLCLNNFSNHEMVFRGDREVSVCLAQWLYQSQALYCNKTVLDMGTGTGIQGIVTAICGAKETVMVDLSPKAIANAYENVKKYDLASVVKIIQSDLFENVIEPVDVIVFNHPFFADYTVEDVLGSSPRITKANLIHRFLRAAPSYFNPNGFIIMPYLHLAGPCNNPHFQSIKHGYQVKELLRTQVPVTGKRLGEMSIFLINPFS